MESTWFSRRALILHLAVLIWTPGCLFAGWWQVTRALGGNDLSYLYSVEWPVFSLVGIWMWWALLHIDPEEVGMKKQRKMALIQEMTGLSSTLTACLPSVQDLTTASRINEAQFQDEEAPFNEDRELAAYNAHLAQLSARGPSTWRHR